MLSSPLARRRSALLAVGAIVAAAFVPLLMPTTQATAASAPQVLFEEGFENTGTTPILLTNYVGTSGTTYTADAGWLRACNGNVLAGNSPTADLALTNCNARVNPAQNAVAYAKLRQLAIVLGQHADPSDPAPEANHVLAAFTDGANPGAGTQMRSSTVTLPASTAAGRYLGLSIDGAAMSCGASGPIYEFSITNPTTSAVTQLGSAALCTDPSVTTVTVPPLDTAGSVPVRVATVESTVATKYVGSSLQATVRNLNPSGSGNDAAVDNMRILDLTPTLEKTFDSPANSSGDSVNLVFTIENTEDLLAKPGWDFTDTLPAGMEVVSPTLTTVCSAPDGTAVPAANITTTAVAGGTSITVAGDLPAGADNCTMSIAVTAPDGSYSNGPGNMTSSFVKTDDMATSTATWASPSDEPETETTPFNTPVTIDPFANFVPAEGDASPTTPDKSTFTFSNGQTSITTAEGAWSYAPATGLVTFTPVDGYTGTTPAMPYTYRDGAGNTVDSTATVIVGGDIANLADTGDQGQPVTVPVTGQTPDIDLTSVRLIDPTSGTAVDGPVTVPGEGVWSVDAGTGAITFTPEAGFEGDPTSIEYTATDGTGADVAPATVTITYPNVSDVAGSGDQGQPVTVPVDVDPGVDPTTVQLIDPATGAPTTSDVVVPGEGTWSVDPATGDVTFTPEAGFTANPTPIEYVAFTADGDQAAPATVTVTYPDVADVSGSGDQGSPVTVPVDLGPGIDPTTVQLIDPATGDPLAGDVIVAGEGTWSVDLTTGAVTFTPEAGFEGDPTPIEYIAFTADGDQAQPATVTVDYPNVSDVSGSGDEGSPVTVPTDLDAGVDPTTVALIDPATGAPATGDVVVAGEGTWSVDPTTGAVTFTPEAGFAGNPTPIEYTAQDADGNAALPATVTITYPSIADVSGSGDQGSPVTVPVDLGPGLDPTTVELIDPATGNPVTGDVVVPGEGTWSVDPDSGAVTFTPEAGFEGDPTPIGYTARDADGNQATPATVTVTYPDVSDVAGSGDQGSPVTVPVDLEPGVDPTTVALIDPATGDPATGDVIIPGEGTWSVNPDTGDVTFTPEAGFEADPTPIEYIAFTADGDQAAPATVTVTYPNVSDVTGAGNQGAPVTVPAALDPGMDPTTVTLIDPVTGAPTTDPVIVAGEGTWTVDPTTGDITFTPEDGFDADPTPIEYTARDADGNEALPATVTITYPDVADVRESGDQGSPVTVDPALGDTIDPTTVQLIDPATGTVATGDVVVPGEGTWSVDPDTGAITFTPEDGFDADPTPIEYTARDADGNQATPATVTVDYPDVSDVSGSGDQGTAVTVPVELAPGTDPTTVKLIDPTSGEPVDGSVFVPGEGVWSVDPETGAITFAPEPGFQGDPTPVQYTASNVDGGQALPATVTVDYPNVSDVTGSGDAGTPVTVPVDLDPGVDPTTVVLIDPATGERTDQPVVVPGEGTWTVDPETGAVTFTPESGFTGDPTPIRYTAQDADGNWATPATVTIDYADVVVPPTPEPTTPTEPITPPTAKPLPATGLDLSPWTGGLIALLIGAGVSLVIAGRRTRARG